MNDSEKANILSATIEYQQKGSKFLSLNKSKPVQLITTTVMNESIYFDLNFFL